jgi:hypothetical protein
MCKHEIYLAESGDLFQIAPDHTWTLVREKHSYHFATIDSLKKVKSTLRAGQHSWPGGYPLFFITECGSSLCFDCVRKEFRQVVYEYLSDFSAGWKVVACSINYEDSDLRCDECSDNIYSAC